MPDLCDTDDEEKDPYDFCTSASSPFRPFSRTSTPGVLRGSARKKSATLVGAVGAIRREERYHESVLSPAAFSSSESGDEVNIIPASQTSPYLPSI